jgi:hypothetical protein
MIINLEIVFCESQIFSNTFNNRHKDNFSIFVYKPFQTSLKL